MMSNLAAALREFSQKWRPRSLVHGKRCRLHKAKLPQCQILLVVPVNYRCSIAGGLLSFLRCKHHHQQHSPGEMQAKCK